MTSFNDSQHSLSSCRVVRDVHQTDVELQSLGDTYEDERMQRHSLDSSHHSYQSNVPTTTTAVITTNDRDNSTDTRENNNTVNTPSNTHTNHLHHIKFKWRNLFSSPEFWGRIVTLVITLLLLSLSSAYCVGQFFYTTLHLVKQCDAKERDEIWKHSYKGGVQNGKIEMNVTSQWGITNEPCWTTDTIDTNTDHLWYSNVYEAHRTTDTISDMNWKALTFGLLSVYFVCTILYNLGTLIHDIVYVSREKLHTTSKQYQYLTENQQNNVSPPKTDTWCHRKIRDLTIWWREYMSDDTTAWILRGVISEMLELLIQTQALLLYGGYNMWDPHHSNDIYLANRPYFIVIFAAILAFNAFGSGVLWLSYALLNEHCHGLLFRVLLFCVDQFSDLLYTLFPFIIILFDDYNVNRRDIYVLLSQLNIESGAFISAFMPLFLLCTKSLMITRETKRHLADRYYEHWKLTYDISREKKDAQALYRAQLAGYKLNADALQNNNKEMYDSKGNIRLSVNRMTSKSNWIRSNVDRKVSFSKQCMLVFIALLYIVYGGGVLYYVTDHLQSASKHCQLIRESNFFVDDTPNITAFALNDQQSALLQSNPELFFWDNCMWKVYPFLGADVESRYHHRCQCRVFVMDWKQTKSTANQRRIYFNISQPVILQNMLQHWFMLEKVKTTGSEREYIRTRITSSMFLARNIKAFEWTNSKIDCIEKGISNWKQLEYLKFGEISLVYELPNDFGGLTSLKYLSFDNNGLQTFPRSICNLTRLEVLNIFLETKMVTIPNCISNLTQLKELVIDNCALLENVPFPIFSLPNLVTLSLFHGQISWQSFVEYNAPNDTDTNDTFAITEWIINSEFKISASIQKIYLSINPICDVTNASWFPIQLHAAFNEESCSYMCDTDGYDHFCPPRLLGNGRCDFICDNNRCQSDHGDCVQLCFASQLTECSYDLYTNDVCDEGCDNDYCTEYYDETFQSKKRFEHMSADLWHCPFNTNLTMTITENTTVNSTNCTESHSNFLDVDPTTKCSIDWIADNVCDDACRTDECAQDGGDCESIGACTDNDCKFIFDAWQTFMEPFVYNVNVSHFCSTVYPLAVQVFGENPLDHYSCTDDSYLYDFNQDQFVNFREFTFLAYSFIGGWHVQGKQINCSECIGMEHYNINNNQIFTNTESDEQLDMCNVD
eukprot:809465_1